MTVRDRSLTSIAVLSVLAAGIWGLATSTEDPGGGPQSEISYLDEATLEDAVQINFDDLLLERGVDDPVASVDCFPSDVERQFVCGIRSRAGQRVNQRIQVSPNGESFAAVDP